MRQLALFKLRAVAALFGWSGLLVDAAQGGDLLLVFPGLGILAGLLPVRWFQFAGPAQLALAALTSYLLPHAVVSRQWLFVLAFFLAMMLNTGLWLQHRKLAAEARAGSAVASERSPRPLVRR